MTEPVLRRYITDNWFKIVDHKTFTTETFSGKLMDNGAYIIYSYKAPIAVCLKGRWFITKQRHSNLTTYHMQCLRYILHEEEIAVRLSNPEQFKDVLNAANAT